MKKYLHKFFLFFLILLSATPSCRKADRDSDISTEMVSDNSLSFFFFNDIFFQFHSLALSDSSLNANGSFFVVDTSCIFSVSHTNVSGSFPDTITLDYGSGNGTACTDGNLRSGKLKIIFPGKYADIRKTFTVYTENYYLNSFKIEGKTEISCRTRNSANNLYFSIEITNGVVSNDSVRLQFFAPCNDHLSTFQREWVSGESTTAISDDIFQITGAYGGMASKGTSYQCEITSPLKNQSDCKWISGGKENFFPLNLSPRIVDYGNGCDKKTLVNINGKDYEISLLP